MQYEACISCGVPFPDARGWKGRRCDACTPPEQKDFPLRLEVTVLRARWRALKTALAAVEQAGAWLGAFERRWPEGARQGLEEWNAMKARIEDDVRKVNG